MKKIILRLIIIALLCLIAVATVFLGAGYSMYSKAIKAESMDDKIADIRSNPNYTKIDDVSQMYKNAVVAVEDHRFYSHCGIDVWAIMRAMARNVKYKELLEGGSTITQQLAKNTYFTQSKELTRKVAEGFMAISYEKKLEKDEILELYINTSYFGNGYYDIKEASLGYFGKLPNEINDYEATMLAGVPNAPSVYAPTVNFKLASERQTQVLNKMVEYGYITDEKKNEILSMTEQYREHFSKGR